MKYWIRQLFSRPGSHLKALAEVLLTALFALLPLLVTAIMYNVKNDDEFTISTVLEQSLGHGQLFLYAYGLLGSIFWLAFFKWDKVVHGPRRVLGFVAITASYPIVAMFGLDPSISNVTNSFLISASRWSYGAFLLINYLLLFFIEIDPPTPENSLRSGSNYLKKKYSQMEHSNG